MNARVAILVTTLTLIYPVIADAQRTTNDSTVVILLGTGMPLPNPRTQGPATAVLYGKRLFLFDAGSGVVRQMSAAHLSTDQLGNVFLTHLHSDHILGLPDVIFTSWIFGRSAPLKLYGPPGTSRMTEHFIAAFAEDIRARTEGLEGTIRNGYRVRARDINTGIVYDSAGVRIRAISVPNNIGIPAFAYRIDTPDRSIVISGDTGPTDVLLTWAKDVDVLVHEVVNMSGINGNFPGGRDMKTYMRTAHTPVEKLAQIAAKTNPGILVLTHIISAGMSEPDMVNGIRAAGYRGRVAFGHDLDRF